MYLQPLAVLLFDMGGVQASAAAVRPADRPLVIFAVGRTGKTGARMHCGPARPVAFFEPVTKLSFSLLFGSCRYLLCFLVTGAPRNTLLSA
jgi:hypothetical protein